MSLPPANFHEAELRIRTIRRKRRWHRIYAAGKGRGPLGAGFGTSRFSDPATPPVFKVAYFGTSVLVCFLEAVLRDSTVGQVPPLPFDEQKRLKALRLATLEVSETLHALDLTGNNLVVMGISTSAARDREQSIGRQWSRAFWQHPAQVDGLHYASRLNGETCLALYDRALAPVPKLAVVDDRPLLSCKAELADIYDRLSIALV